jgi:hypothetical protein
MKYATRAGVICWACWAQSSAYEKKTETNGENVYERELEKGVQLRVNRGGYFPITFQPLRDFISKPGGNVLPFSGTFRQRGGADRLAGTLSDGLAEKVQKPMRLDVRKKTLIGGRKESNYQREQGSMIQRSVIVA